MIFTHLAFPPELLYNTPATVAIKIIDMLGEEVLETVSV